jgi:multiple sugar transport system substrate-binding protein
MNNRFTRRDTIKLGAGVGAAALLGSTSLRAAIPTADATPPDLPIEDGATLRVLRPSRFVDGDEIVFNEKPRPSPPPPASTCAST